MIEQLIQLIFDNIQASYESSWMCFCEHKARWNFPKRWADFQQKNVPIIVYTCFDLQDYCELKNFDIESVRIRTKKHKQDQLKNAWRWLNGGLHRLWFTRKKPTNLKNTVKHRKMYMWHLCWRYSDVGNCLT